MKPLRQAPTAAAGALAAAIIVVGTVTGCSTEPERWEQRGFDSESECWLNHGWDGSVSDGANRKELFDWWCGPIADD